MDPFKLVETFNKEVVEVPERTLGHKLVLAEAKWLVDTFQEESIEFVEAWDTNDTTGQVDALIDLIYFAMGGLTRLGLDSEQSNQIFQIVHDANMAKKRGNKGRGSDMDAVKPESWESPEAKIADILGISKEK